MIQLLAAVLTLCAALSAQVELPTTNFPNRPGNHAFAFFGLAGTTAVRWMAGTYSDVPAGTYTEIALRPKWEPTAILPGADFAQVRIHHESLSVPAGQALDYWTFEGTVVDRTNVVFPDSPQQGDAALAAQVAQPWAWVIPLDTPIVHPGGTLRLCFEFWPATAAEACTFDAHYDRRNPWSGTPPPYFEGPASCHSLQVVTRTPLVMTNPSDPYYGQMTMRQTVAFPALGFGESDWTAVGLATPPVPFGDCNSLTDGTLTVVPAGNTAALPYVPGIEQFGLGLSMQTVRLDATGFPRLTSRPVYWSFSFVGLLTPSWGEPSFSGRGFDESFNFVWSIAPAVRIQ